MSYTINQVAQRFNISAYTIRYYEKEGLLPFVSRNKSGIREFTDSDINIFTTICCLKNTGMSIKEIGRYIGWLMEGTSSIDERKNFLLKHRNEVLKQISTLEDNLKQIDLKIETYQSPDAVRIINESIKFISEEKRLLGLQSTFNKHFTDGYGEA
ncbi:MerR family transcriptional regulator [Clostridium algidicarnis]|uniref:MerR family transcriptional regulator n=1 Tax=Clostridium algidicarnis TaxID=37659 RepID=UPI003FD886E2